MTYANAANQTAFVLILFKSIQSTKFQVVSWPCARQTPLDRESNAPLVGLGYLTCCRMSSQNEVLHSSGLSCLQCISITFIFLQLIQLNSSVFFVSDSIPFELASPRMALICQKNQYHPPKTMSAAVHFYSTTLFSFYPYVSLLPAVQSSSIEICSKTSKACQGL